MLSIHNNLSAGAQNVTGAYVVIMLVYRRLLIMLVYRRLLIMLVYRRSLIIRLHGNDSK